MDLPDLFPHGRIDWQTTARVELFRESPVRYTCQVWFIESLRVTPTEQALDASDGTLSSENTHADKPIPCLVDALGFDDLREQSLDAIRDAALGRLAQLFEQS